MGRQAYVSKKINLNEEGCAELSGFRLNEVAGSCEHGHELFCFTKRGKFE